MDVITILIPIAILLVVFFIGGCIWMTMKGQYDDLTTPAYRMLVDDKEMKKQTETATNINPIQSET